MRRSESLPISRSPAGQLRSGEIVKTAKRCLQFGRPAHGDDMIQGALGCAVQLIEAEAAAMLV